MAGVLESSLRVSAAIEAPFEAYREAPPPDAPAAAGVLVFWCCVGVFLCLGLAVLRLPQAPPPARLAIVGAAALGLLVLGALGAAALFHLAAHLRGADVPFERSLLLVALVSPLLPAHLALFWAPVPYLWALTTVYSAWLCSRGLIRMGLLSDGTAAALAAFIGLSSAGVQGYVVLKSGRAQPEPQEASLAPAAGAPLAPPTEKVRAASSAKGGPPRSGDGGSMAAASVAGVPSSGLDMVQRSEEMDAVPGQDTAFAPETNADSNKRLRSLDRWSERLGINGDLTQGLPAQQKLQILSMKQALDGIREEAKKTGVVPTKEEVLLRVLMQAGGSKKSSTGAKDPPAKKPRKAPAKKRRVVEEEDQDEDE